MAALTPVDAEVQPSANSRLSGTAGAQIARAGVPLRKDSAGHLIPATDASLAGAQAEGISTHGAEDGQPIAYQSTGDMDFGASAGVTQGVVYTVGTDGAIEPIADKLSGDYLTILGPGLADNKIRLAITASGVPLL